MSTVYGQTEDDRIKWQKVWSEYKTVKNISSDPTLCAAWAIRLEAAYNDPILNWGTRSAFLMEAAILHAAGGEPDTAYKAYGRLYEGAVPENDAVMQWASLNYMANHSKSPMTKADLDKTIGLYDALQALLAKPPLGEDGIYQQHLADTYYEYGRVLRRAADRIEGLDDDARRALYERSARNLEVFHDLGMFVNESRANGLLELGESCAKAGRTGDAIAAFKGIVALPRSTVAPMYAMWRAIEIEYPRREDRIAPMEKALDELAVDNYGDAFKQQLVFEYLEAKMWDKAITLVSQIQETGEGDEVNAYNMFLLATALRRSGRVGDAEAVLKELLREYRETGIAENLVTKEQRIIEMQRKDLLGELDVTIDEKVTELGTGQVVAGAEAESVSKGPVNDGSGEGGRASGKARGALRRPNLRPASYRWAVLGVGIVAVAGAVVVTLLRRKKKGRG